MSVLQPRPSKPGRFGLFRVRSPLLAESFLFLWVLRCFSSPGSPPTVYVFNRGMTLVHNAGFPHSEILGSKPAHGYPRLIAVFHVLLRHLAPRHSPYALSSLTRRDAEKLKIFPSCYSVVKVRLLREAACPSRSAARPPSFTAHLPMRCEARSSIRLRQNDPAYRRVRCRSLADDTAATCYSVLAFPLFPKPYRAPCFLAQVEMTGLEPVTSALQRQRSPS